MGNHTHEGPRNARRAISRKPVALIAIASFLLGVIAGVVGFIKLLAFAFSK